MPHQPLKNPPETPDAVTECINYVNTVINQKYPVADPPPPVYGGFPSPMYVSQAFAYQGVTKEAIGDRFLLGLSYYGDPGDFAHNSIVRTNAFVVGHDLISSLVARSFALGLPFPPASQVVVTPLVATFSNAAILARLALQPVPIRYDGAPCYSAGNAEFWKEQITIDLIRTKANRAWSVVPDETLSAMAISLWLNADGPATQYSIDPNDIAGFTAAQVFRKYDQGTAPGVPATA